MPERKDTSTFIAEARRVHGDKYDYSRVVYLSQHGHVAIICRQHGEFLQRPHSHRRGMGCRSCAALRRTAKNATFCRFCGKRCTLGNVSKRCCDSQECVRLHQIEKHRSTGDSRVDFVRSAWSREKKRQKSLAKSEIEKRCQRAYRSVWMAKRYRKQLVEKEEEERKEITEQVIKERLRNRKRWAGLTPMEKKIKVFVRETNSGRRHMANRKGGVRMKELIEKLKQQGNRCALSGEAIDSTNADVDHIVPVSRGGSSEIDNLQFLSRRINRMKGTMTNEEFIESCLMVVKYTLRQAPPTPRLGPS